MFTRGLDIFANAYTRTIILALIVIRSRATSTCMYMYMYNNPFRTKTPKYLFLRGKTSILSSNWQHKFLYFHYKSVKLDVLCRQNKIWTFGHPFQSKKLPICTKNSDFQSLYMYITVANLRIHKLFRLK